MKLARPEFWTERTLLSYVLWPLSLLFRAISSVRRIAYRSGLMVSWRSPVPVIVIGNITVGGAGKTPLVIALCDSLKEAGYSVGIVARGYGGKVDGTMDVTLDSDVTMVGDEPLLLATRTGVPVVVSVNRVDAVKHLINHHHLDCVLCDDGLQHYALKRDIEIAVVDARYRFGNGFCLPAGPLREPVKRLAQVDFTVFSGLSRGGPEDEPSAERGYSLVGNEIVNSGDQGIKQPLAQLAGGRVHAVAGIASPANFYKFLEARGIEPIPHSFGDHAVFVESDLQFDDDLPVVMTEKDMVKCRGFGMQNLWYLPVTACIDHDLAGKILSRIEYVVAERENNAD